MSEKVRTVVFISYASEQREVAEDINSVLTIEGYDVFFDKAKLKPAGGFDPAIRRHIDRCHILVFLISPAVVEKEASYALTELALAQKKWPSPVGRILPVVVEQTSRDKIPAYLRRVTPLHTEGDIAAEVAAEIHRLAQRNDSAGNYVLNTPLVAGAQLEAYRALWSLTGRLPKWGRSEQLRYEDLDAMSKNLRRWYFDDCGGLFLSQGVYSHYAEVQDAIRFLLADAPSGMLDAVHYEEIRILCSRLRRFIAAEIGTRS